MILETSTPNTPNIEPGDLSPEYPCLSPALPCLTLEASEGSEETAVDSSNKSQSSSAIQAEITEIVQRVQREIDLDQHAFGSYTYHNLHQIDQTHHQNNPHLYQLSDVPDEQLYPTFPQELQEDEVEEEEEEEIIITH